MDNQMTIFDFGKKSYFESAYDIFHEHCKNRGWLKGTTETDPSTWMCGFANKQFAKCWDDWIPCTCENCPLKEEK